jgi:tetratricopeptide (TPR) repeat protein
LLTFVFLIAALTLGGLLAANWRETRRLRVQALQTRCALERAIERARVVELELQWMAAARPAVAMTPPPPTPTEVRPDPVPAGTSPATPKTSGAPAAGKPQDAPPPPAAGRSESAPSQPPKVLAQLPEKAEPTLPSLELADCSVALPVDPWYAATYINRGNSWWTKKEYERALADYSVALQLDPGQADAYNNRAWLWATCPDAKYRDGKQAVASATRACELSGWKEADHIGTLAAASAEAGDFDAAVKWQSQANGLYADAGDAKKGEERLRLYQEKRPYRETPP